RGRARQPLSARCGPRRTHGGRFRAARQAAAGPGPTRCLGIQPRPRLTYRSNGRADDTGSSPPSEAAGAAQSWLGTDYAGVDARAADRISGDPARDLVDGLRTEHGG